MTDKKKNLIVRSITGVLFVAIMVAGFLNSMAMILLFTIIYLLVSELYAKNRNAVTNMAYTMLGQMYIALPLALINVLAFKRDEYGNFSGYDMLLPLSVFILLWANDSGAYCFGSMFGKHKLFPRISPGKTWEGSVGGGIFAVVIAGVIGILANSGSEAHVLNVAQWLGLGAVVVVFGTWGDLVESLFKRTIGVKDSGKILPGHGGMMDRFDSSLLAIPAAVLYLYTITLCMQ